MNRVNTIIKIAMRGRRGGSMVKDPAALSEEPSIYMLSHNYASSDSMNTWHRCGIQTYMHLKYSHMKF